MKERAIANEKKVAAAKSPVDLAAQSPGFAAVQFATAAAWAPDPKNPPLYFDLPTKDGEPESKIVAKFAANSPLAFVDQYIGNLKQHRAIAMDVGDQDGLRFDATKLHNILDNFGVANSFEIYPGSTQAPSPIVSSTKFCRSSARTSASRQSVASVCEPVCNPGLASHRPRTRCKCRNMAANGK